MITKTKIFQILFIFVFINKCLSQERVYIGLVAENNLIGIGPELMGIGMGHSSLNGNWAKFLERLGANAARLFVEPITNLRSFIGTTNWGLDLNGNLVNDLAKFQNAVKQLRSAQGRNLIYEWANPVKWQQIFESFKKVTRSIYGNDENTINLLNKLNISVLLVEQIGCDSFQFTEMNKNSATYWSERWELYKFSYALAVWARNKGVNIIEFYNEPDLDLESCLNSSIFNEHYLIRSLSIQNAYEDHNQADYFNIKLAASAFARRTFGGDLTRFLGSLTVENRNILFGTFENNKNWNNMHLYSYHSYDKTGRDLFDDLIYLKSSITSAGASYPVILTEHNSHTSSNWDTLTTTSDTNSEASRLSSQIANIIRANCSTAHYVFKFSITPSFSPNREIAKNGLHWAEIKTDPFDLSDSTLSAESFRLMSIAKQSKLYSIISNDTSKFRSYLGVRKANNDNYLLIVNDKIDILSLNINLTQLGVGSTSRVLVETVSEQSFGEIKIMSVALNGILNVLLPGFSTSKLTIRNYVPNISSIDSELSCTAYAGSQSHVSNCVETFNLIGTSDTSQHESTSIGLIKFKIAELNRGKLFLLKLNIEQTIYDSTLLVLGVKNSLLASNITNYSWNYLKENGILKTLSSGERIDSIGKNFINWTSNGSADLCVIGHVTALKDQINKQTIIDVADYVRFMIDAGKKDLFFILYRPFRHPTYTTSIGLIESDDLAFGTNVKISSSANSSLNKPQILII